MKYDPDIVSLDVDGMTLAEEGAYSRCVRHLWRHGPLPEAKLSRLCGENWEAVRATMEQGPEGWSFAWLEAAREGAQTFVAQRSKAGKASAEKRTAVEQPLNSRSTPVLSLSNSLSNFPSKSKDARDENFETFYAAYPEKKAKADALKAWGKLDADTRAKCLPAILAQVKADHFKGVDGKNYIPHPATWLNQGRYDDEIKRAAAPVHTPWNPRA